MCVSAALTFQTSGVKLDEELGSAGRLHDGLDTLELYVGLLRSLGQTWGTPRTRRKKQKPWVRHADNSQCSTKGRGKTYGHTDFERPQGSIDSETKWPCAFSHVPFLETNWDVTPTSKVANTGEWSLVTMSSVQPDTTRQEDTTTTIALQNGLAVLRR